MYSYKYDDFHALLAARLAPGGDQQADFALHLGRILACCRDVAPRGRRLALLTVLDRGHAMPDPKTRARLAVISGLPEFNPYVAVVTTSATFRGVFTALSWLRPKHRDDTIVRSPAEALRWLESMRGEPLPTLRSMIDALLDEAPLQQHP